ncbi:MAG TPA: hypothetical protein VHA55_04460 [Pseudorhodoplanes sp.]|jgi:hypothetical protein|nr:hypothetical protein [Pseudorhodoplanes sp.]
MPVLTRPGADLNRWEGPGESRPAPGPIREAIAQSARLAAPAPAYAARLQGLVANEAWVDAALMLVAIERPRWVVRAIVLADGEWFCSLSREPRLPDWLDEIVSERDAALPLAILKALAAARRTAPPECRAAAADAAHASRCGTAEAVCCDNFG